MSAPQTLPKVTPILVCKAGKGQRLQIQRSQVEKLLATDKAPYFDVFAQVQFLLLDDVGNPVADEKDPKRLKAVTVDRGIVSFLVGVIQR